MIYFEEVYGELVSNGIVGRHPETKRTLTPAVWRCNSEWKKIFRLRGKREREQEKIRLRDQYCCMKSVTIS